MNANKATDEIEQGKSETVREPAAEPPIWPWILPLAAYMILLMLDPKLDDNPYANLGGSEKHWQAVTLSTTGHPSNHPTPAQSSDPSSKAIEEENSKSPSDPPPTPKLATGKVWHYTLVTLLRFVIVGGILFLGFRHYRKQFPLRIGILWLPVGVVGVVVWIWLCELNLEQSMLVALGLNEDVLGARAAFNPFDAFGSFGMLIAFLVIRFAILSIIVPLAEEIFLRGFVMRMLHRPDWWKADLGKLKYWVLAVAPVYGVITHPSEFLAAAVWFGLVSALMVYTRNLWECVMAHATTNLLLGIYVISFSQWQLW